MFHVYPVSRKDMGLSQGLSGVESLCQSRGHRCDPWSRKSQHAMEQLSPWATTVEPVLSSPGAVTSKACKCGSLCFTARDACAPQLSRQLGESPHGSKDPAEPQISEITNQTIIQNSQRTHTQRKEKQRFKCERQCLTKVVSCPVGLANRSTYLPATVSFYSWQTGGPLLEVTWWVWSCFRFAQTQGQIPVTSLLALCTWASASVSQRRVFFTSRDA